MPLITLCGFPCVGKTKFASQLASQIENMLHKTCVVINEETLHLSKPDHYKSASQEKLLRQNLKSAVEHALINDTVVIVDSSNYIKGYRYELYCIARSQRTPHCVVHVTVENALADQWNKDNSEILQYDAATLEELRRRFEAPNECNRWDKPLFEVNMNADMDATGDLKTSTILQLNSETASLPDNKANDIDMSVSSHILKEKEANSDIGVEKVKQCDGLKDTVEQPVTVFSSWKSSKVKRTPSSDSSVSSMRSTVSSCVVKKSPANANVFFSGSRANDVVVSASDGPEVVIRKICDYFLSADAPPPSTATHSVRHSSADLLYHLDKVSQAITQSIVSHQQKHGPESPLVFKEYGDITFVLPRKMSMAELQRHRRQYIKVNSQHPPESVLDAGKNFLLFLLNQS